MAAESLRWQRGLGRFLYLSGGVCRLVGLFGLLAAAAFLLLILTGAAELRVWFFWTAPGAAVLGLGGIFLRELGGWLLGILDCCPAVGGATAGLKEGGLECGTSGTKGGM